MKLMVAEGGNRPHGGRRDTIRTRNSSSKENNFFSKSLPKPTTLNPGVTERGITRPLGGSTLVVSGGGPGQTRPCPSNLLSKQSAKK